MNFLGDPNPIDQATSDAPSESISSFEWFVNLAGTVELLLAALAIVIAIAVPWKIHRNELRRQRLESNRIAMNYRVLAINEMSALSASAQGLARLLDQATEAAKTVELGPEGRKIAFTVTTVPEEKLEKTLATRAFAKDLNEVSETWAAHLTVPEIESLALVLFRLRVLDNWVESVLKPHSHDRVNTLVVSSVLRASRQLVEACDNSLVALKRQKARCENRASKDWWILRRSRH